MASPLHNAHEQKNEDYTSNQPSAARTDCFHWSGITKTGWEEEEEALAWRECQTTGQSESRGHRQSAGQQRAEEVQHSHVLWKVTDSGRHLRRNRRDICGGTAEPRDQVDLDLLDNMLAMDRALTDTAPDGEEKTTTPSSLPKAKATPEPPALRRSNRTIRPPEKINL